MNIIVFLQLILTPIMPITEMSSLLWLLYFTLFTIKSAIFQGHLLILFSFQAHKKKAQGFYFPNLRSFYDQSDPFTQYRNSKINIKHLLITPSPKAATLISCFIAFLSFNECIDTNVICTNLIIQLHCSETSLFLTACHRWLSTTKHFDIHHHF